MENEKKTVPEANAEKGNHNHKNNYHKRKPHKPKSYYITPEGNTEASKPAADTRASSSSDAQKPQQNKPRADESTQSKQNPNRQSSQGNQNRHSNRRGKPHGSNNNSNNSNSNSNSNNNNNNNNNNNSHHPKKDNQKEGRTVKEAREVKEVKEAKEVKEVKEASVQATQNAPAVQNQNANKSGKNNRRRKNKPHHQNKPTEEHIAAEAPQKEPPKQNDTLDISLMPSQRSLKSDRLETPVKKLDKFANSPEYAKYSDYEEFTFDELYGEKTEQKHAEMAVSEDNSPVDTPAQTEDEPTVEVVGIRFKPSGKTYYFEPCDIKLKVGTHAIVKTARGLEYGEVALGNTFVKESETVPPLRPVVREATPEDIKHHADNKAKEDEAFHICNEKIIEHELEMKLIDAQYTFDNTKLLFYFTSAGRVDFRELVKDLASVFRTRIELRQIGIRDEAKMVGGLGLCGRPLCCSLFLSDFGQVSIKMAKDQNLSLNSSKISGICGRLMCCLRYEYEAYEYEIKHTPPVDSLVRTVDGVGTVTEISPIAGTIKVKLHDADAPPKTYKRDEVTVLKKKNG